MALPTMSRQTSAAGAATSPAMHSMPFPSAGESPATPTLSDSTSPSASSHNHSDENLFSTWPANASSPSLASASTAGKLPPLHRVSTDVRRSPGDISNAESTPRPKSSASSSGGQSASRPSSIVSTSSAGEVSLSGSKYPVSPSILSPSLASALGINAEHRRQTNSFYAVGGSNGSTSSLNAGYTSSSPSTGVNVPGIHAPRTSRRSAGGPSGSSSASSGGASHPRRPSLPNVPSMSQHRVSTVSVSSFESLPEHDILPTFAGSPMMVSQPVSRQSSTRSRSREGMPDSPGLGPTLMLPPSSLPSRRETTYSSSSSTGHFSSPPCSPTTPFAETSTSSSRPSSSRGSRQSSGSSSRPGRLQRSQTEPSNGSNIVSVDERMRKRGLIAKELVTTEQAYVECLRVIKDSFYQPLFERCGGLRGSPNPAAGPAILPKKAIADIFSNFIDILQLNVELLTQLEARICPRPSLSGTQAPSVAKIGVAETSNGPAAAQEAPGSGQPQSNGAWDPERDTIGDILVPIAPFLKMYSTYVKNFSSALGRIETERKENDAFARFLKETERGTWGRGKGFFGLGLQAHLLSIVQRIPRYKLLVGDLLKNTPPLHRDHNDLQKAFGMIEQVASSINENVHQQEMVMLILALQRSLVGVTTPLVVPGRSLIKRGTLMKACRKDIQARAFFLFTDCIMYARPASGGGPAVIEAAWAAIARAGGISSTGPLAKFGTQPLSASTTRRGSFDHAFGAPSDALQPRVRVSSGNLFSANTILDALQTQQTPQLQYREQIALQDCTVVGIEDNAASHSVAGAIEAGGTPFAFEIRTPDKSFAVYAESAESRESWLEAIREARNDWLQSRRTLQAEEDSILARRDRRRSVAAATAAARARQSVYSLATPSATIHEGQVLPDSAPVTADTSANNPPGAVMRPTSLTSLSTSASLAALLSTGGAQSASSVPLRVLEDYNAPAWVPDSRADKCMSCSEPFSVFRRKHHCRLCGRVVCWSCSTQKFIIASYDEEKEDAVARACDSCYESTFPPLSPSEDETELQANSTADSSQFKEAPTAASGKDQVIPFPSKEDGKSSRTQSVRPTVVRFESQESSEENDGPATPIEGQALAQNGRTEILTAGDDRLAAEANTEPHVRHIKSLTAPLKALALEGGPMTAPDQLHTTAPDAFQQGAEPTFSAARANARLPPRFPTSIGGNHPGGPRGPARAALARLSTTSSLGPHVHAATSGSGTFRLAPPRVTTPESENGPITRLFEVHAHQKGLMGVEGSYFAGATIPEDAVASHAPEQVGVEPRAALRASTSAIANNSSPPRQKAVASRQSFGGVSGGSGSSSGSSSPGGPFDPAIARHRSSRKKPMSAAARLSTYYGSSLTMSAGSGSGNATPKEP